MPLIHQLPIAKIRKNPLFNWFSTRQNQLLQHSVQHHGILQPLSVAMIDHSYELVDGYQRYQIMQELNMQEAPVFTLEISSMKELLSWRLHTLPHTSISGMQVCQIIHSLHQHGFTKDELITQALPQLGFKESPKLLSDFLSLAKVFSESEHLSYLHSYTAEQLLPLLRFSTKEFPSLIECGASLELGGNKWKALLLLLHELKRLYQTTMDVFLFSEPIISLWKNTELDRSVRYRHFKKYLDQLRYPELSHLRKQVQSTIFDLNLPANVKLIMDPFFEKEGITLEVNAETLEKLSKQLEAIHFCIETKEASWKQLFDLVE